MKKSDMLAKALAEALEAEAQIEGKFGSEPPKSSVIRFRVVFHRGGTAYDYAAIRAKSDGLWYTTGPNSPKGYTWEELTSWLIDKAKVTKFSVMK